MSKREETAKRRHEEKAHLPKCYKFAMARDVVMMRLEALAPDAGCGHGEAGQRGQVEVQSPFCSSLGLALHGPDQGCGLHRAGLILTLKQHLCMHCMQQCPLREDFWHTSACIPLEKLHQVLAPLSERELEEVGKHKGYVASLGPGEAVPPSLAEKCETAKVCVRACVRVCVRCAPLEQLVEEGIVPSAEVLVSMCSTAGVFPFNVVQTAILCSCPCALLSLLTPAKQQRNSDSVLLLQHMRLAAAPADMSMDGIVRVQLFKTSCCSRLQGEPASSFRSPIALQEKPCASRQQGPFPITLLERSCAPRQQGPFPIALLEKPCAPRQGSIPYSIARKTLCIKAKGSIAVASNKQRIPASPKLRYPPGSHKAPRLCTKMCGRGLCICCHSHMQVALLRPLMAAAHTTDTPILYIEQLDLHSMLLARAGRGGEAPCGFGAHCGYPAAIAQTACADVDPGVRQPPEPAAAGHAGPGMFWCWTAASQSSKAGMHFPLLALALGFCTVATMPEA
eukprot:scaffold4814_cov22-Tisochrysis_lutea.AAC.2